MLDDRRETANQLMSESTSSKLTLAEVNRLTAVEFFAVRKKGLFRYYKVEKGFVQEAFREFYKFTDAEGQKEIPVKGCKALYNEVQVWMTR